MSTSSLFWFIAGHSTFSQVSPLLVCLQLPRKAYMFLILVKLFSPYRWRENTHMPLRVYIFNSWSQNGWTKDVKLPCPS